MSEIACLNENTLMLIIAIGVIAGFIAGAVWHRWLFPHQGEI